MPAAARAEMPESKIEKKRKELSQLDVEGGNNWQSPAGKVNFYVILQRFHKDCLFYNKRVSIGSVVFR